MNSITPNLMVENVNKTIQYYKDTLGFELIMSVPRDGGFQWALMGCHDVEIMFQSRTSISREIELLEGSDIGASQTLYISVTGIEELYNRVKEKVEILKELHTTFYGMTEFTMKDINGYILVFSDRL